MPTLLFVRGLRFFFYSNENNEPAHVHVMKGDAEGKIWLGTEIEIAYLHGFTKNEERDIIEIVEANKNNFIKKWHEYFNQ